MKDLLSLIASAATAADTSAAGSSFAGEEDVFVNGGTERVAIRSHGNISEGRSLPGLDVLATGSRDQQAAQSQAADD